MTHAASRQLRSERSSGTMDSVAFSPDGHTLPSGNSYGVVGCVMSALLRTPARPASKCIPR
jgi:hypothetical protein